MEMRIFKKIKKINAQYQYQEGNSCVPVWNLMSKCDELSKEIAHLEFSLYSMDPF